MKNNASILALYAVTPCHAGSGSSTGVVDLPIQRERHTNWPVIQASGVKGALRAHVDRFKGCIKEKPQEKTFKQITALIFGAETQQGDHAGSLSIGDAKILAFPMRSNIAPFVWITCPAVLKRLNRDLALIGEKEIDLSPLEKLNEDAGKWIIGKTSDASVLLEDMEIQVDGDVSLGDGKVKQLFAQAERLLVVSDTVFGYGVTHCTQIMAQIKIDQASGTTEDGSLRYQEELPADTLMYSMIFWGDSRDEATSLKQEAIRGYIEKEVVTGHLQIGGDETLGRGIFAVTWI